MMLREFFDNLNNSVILVELWNTKKGRALNDFVSMRPLPLCKFSGSFLASFSSKIGNEVRCLELKNYPECWKQEILPCCELEASFYERLVLVI